MQDKRSQWISLLIDGHKVRLEVVPEEETLYRRAAETYNKRVNQYKALYTTADKEVARLMAAVDMALQLELCKQWQDPKPVEEQLELLTNELNEFLDSNEP